jgi:hypothetical protein
VNQPVLKKQKKEENTKIAIHESDKPYEVHSPTESKTASVAEYWSQFWKESREWITWNSGT